jgi:hypothetical protein
MSRKWVIATGVAAAVLASLAAGSPLFAVRNGAPDARQHPAVGFIFAQQTDPAVCKAEVAGCHGVLIAPDVFLTSGYCAAAFSDPSLSGLNLTAVWVSLNSDNPFDCSTAIKVREFYVHPGFDETARDAANDVGVMILDTPSSAAPATLPTAGGLDSLNRGDLLTVVGYGGVTGQNILEYVRRSGPASLRSSDTETLISRFDNRDQCTAGFEEGAGTFIGSTNELAGLAVLFSGPCRKVVSQRLDTPGVRDFLGSFVTLP